MHQDLSVRERERERGKGESDFLKFHICHRVLCSINILWCTILRIRDDWLQRKIGKSYAIKNTWCHWFQILLFRLVCVCFFVSCIFWFSRFFLFLAFILLYFLFASIYLIWKVNEITFVVRANKLCEFISMWFVKSVLFIPILENVARSCWFHQNTETPVKLSKQSQRDLYLKLS